MQPEPILVGDGWQLSSAKLRLTASLHLLDHLADRNAFLLKSLLGQQRACPQGMQQCRHDLSCPITDRDEATHTPPTVPETRVLVSIGFVSG